MKTTKNFIKSIRDKYAGELNNISELCDACENEIERNNKELKHAYITIWVLSIALFLLSLKIIHH